MTPEVAQQAIDDPAVFMAKALVMANDAQTSRIVRDLTTTAPTMSSRELADLTEKLHANVKRTIETLAAKGIVAFSQTDEKSTGGRPTTLFHVNQRDSYVIVAQLSPEFTARLVDRWQEL
ncbi:Rha family transcriptional regulator [Variovorax robiniae]|uniref:Rha family transcriptional regulator n=1 Tax=Variovorax robiniae TaxID=1836199 RepID=A0ABU8XIY0_9BURK